jgi:hypothetical protein
MRILWERMGAYPGAAFFGRGDYNDDRGFRGKNAFDQIWNAEGIFKGEPTVQGNLTGYVQYNNRELWDIPIPSTTIFTK